MKLYSDRDRLLIALGAALVFHLAVAVGLSFVDWSVEASPQPLSVDLGTPIETEALEEPEPEPEEPEPEEPEPEEPEPEEPEEFEPEASEPDTPEETLEPEPDEPAAEAEAEPEPTEPAEEVSPEEQTEAPAPRGPQGPTEEEVAEALRGLEGGAERERPERTRTEDVPRDPDNAVIEARQQAREEFEQALEEERRAAAEADADADEETTDAGGDPQQEVSPRISDLLGRVRDASQDPTTADDVSETEGQPAAPDAAEDDPDADGDGIVDWDGDGDRRLVEYSVPDVDGSDLRATGAPRVRARITFEVNDQGIVLPGSVSVDGPGLTSSGREKLVEAVQQWRFDRRPGASVARGTIDFIFERT